MQVFTATTPSLILCPHPFVNTPLSPQLSQSQGQRVKDEEQKEKFKLQKSLQVKHSKGPIKDFKDKEKI